jgi:hypothetical protein
MIGSVVRRFSFCTLLAFLPFACAKAEQDQMSSYHVGIFYPNGADIVGYTVEKNITDKFYSFYTFGFPAIASIGATYYEKNTGDGFVTSAGIGLGYLSMFHASISYQWKIETSDYFKLGAGVAATLVYNGAFPVISYEHRFR